MELGKLFVESVHAARYRDRPQSEIYKDRVISRLGLMHGLPQKIGQILSFSELKDGGVAFSRLNEYEATMSLSLVEEQFFKSFQKEFKDVFEWVDSDGISASIGQVHKACLLGGKVVALKCQYPEIHDAIHTDLKALGWLTKPVGGLDKGFDLQAYKREIGYHIEQELDYHHEAEQQLKMQHLVQSLGNRVMVPKVISEWSSSSFLTTEWLEGQAFTKVHDWERQDKEALAEVLLELFLTSFLEWGYIHGDPHPGNYRFIKATDSVRVGLLDFGCTKNVSSETRQALIHLIDMHIETNRINQEAVWNALLLLGFNADLLAPLKDRMVLVSEILFEPFKVKGSYQVTKWNLSSRLSEVLGEHRMTFRTAGPPEMIYVVRAYQGLIQYLKALNVTVSWQLIYQKVRDNIRLGKLNLGRDTIKEEVSSVSEMKSELLRIRVSEGPITKVDLTFNARAVDNLEDLVPEEFKDRLEKHTIDLNQVIQDTQKSYYAPGDLIQILDNQKKVRIWLE